MSTLTALPLEDLGALQARYQPLPLRKRAQTLLEDSADALAQAERVVSEVATHPSLKTAFATLRKNGMLMGKMRPSAAKTLLMDGSTDFALATQHKLAAWKKTLERVQAGEDVVTNKDKEHIPGSAPVALAVIGNAGIGQYLGVVQLAISELVKLDAPAQADTHRARNATLRRCVTLLGDYEAAAALQGFIR